MHGVVVNTRRQELKSLSLGVEASACALSILLPCRVSAHRRGRVAPIESVG